MHGCVARAASTYHVPVAAIEKVLGQHGTAGIGAMGIPAAWLPILRRAGFPAVKLRHDRCLNIAAGAWILAADKRNRHGASHAKPGHNAPSTAHRSVKRLAAREGVPASCITEAAKRYGLPIRLFSAVLRTEGAHVGEVHHNRNGTVDLGPAQVNSIWLPRLRAAGITKTALIHNGCLNLSVGAWILGKAMRGANPADPTDWWRHVGDYNSHTLHLNRRYARLVWEHSRR